MPDINLVRGLGFEIFSVPQEQLDKNGYECTFHKIVASDEPISAEQCGNPVRFGVCNAGEEYFAAMCHEHFQRFAADMVDALSVFVDDGTFDGEPELITNTKEGDAITRNALVDLAAHIKSTKEGANQ